MRNFLKVHTVKTNWIENEKFDSIFETHHVIIDNSIKGGGTDAGSQPKPLMLMALSGCVGMNLVTLLNKMRIGFSDMSFIANGILSETTPKVYTQVQLIIKIKCNIADQEKIAKAIVMTEEKYCGVSDMFKKFCELTIATEFI